VPAGCEASCKIFRVLLCKIYMFPCALFHERKCVFHCTGIKNGDKLKNVGPHNKLTFCNSLFHVPSELHGSLLKDNFPNSTAIFGPIYELNIPIRLLLFWRETFRKAVTLQLVHLSSYDYAETLSRQVHSYFLWITGPV
jgi:hypothetical protein